MCLNNCSQCSCSKCSDQLLYENESRRTLPAGARHADPSRIAPWKFGLAIAASHRPSWWTAFRPRSSRAIACCCVRTAYRARSTGLISSRCRTRWATLQTGSLQTPGNAMAATMRRWSSLRFREPRFSPDLAASGLRALIALWLRRPASHCSMALWMHRAA